MSVRLCYNTRSVNAEKTKDGRWKVEGPLEFEVEAVQLIVDYLDTVNFTFHQVDPGRNTCVNSLNSNTSNFAYSLTPITEMNEFYRVPTLAGSSTVMIMSGYEVNSYVASQSNKTTTELGLMDNLSSFADLLTSFVSLVTAMALILCIWFHLWVNSKKGPKTENQKLWKVLVAHIDQCYHSRLTQFKLLTFIMFTAIFLIETPYLALFNTKQVVTEKPLVISDYKTLMSVGAKIWHGSEDEKAYFEPSFKFDDEQNNVKLRFWRYFKGHNITPAKNKSGESSIGLELIYPVAKDITSGKFVFMGVTQLIIFLDSFMCVASQEGELFRTFYYKDPSASEILLGSTIRWDMDSRVQKYLEKRARSMFEMGTSITPSLMQPKNYHFLPFLIQSQEHRREQLDFCMDKRVVAYDREETHSNDILFFKSFWLLIALLQLLALCILAIELFVARKKKPCLQCKMMGGRRQCLRCRRMEKRSRWMRMSNGARTLHQFYLSNYRMHLPLHLNLRLTRQLLAKHEITRRFSHI